MNIYKCFQHLWRQVFYEVSTSEKECSILTLHSVCCMNYFHVGYWGRKDPFILFLNLWWYFRWTRNPAIPTSKRKIICSLCGAEGIYFSGFSKYKHDLHNTDTCTQLCLFPYYIKWGLSVHFQKIFYELHWELGENLMRSIRYLSPSMFRKNGSPSVSSEQWSISPKQVLMVASVVESLGTPHLRSHSIKWIDFPSHHSRSSGTTCQTHASITLRITTDLVPIWLWWWVKMKIKSDLGTKFGWDSLLLIKLQGMTRERYLHLKVTGRSEWSHNLIPNTHGWKLNLSLPPKKNIEGPVLNTKNTMSYSYPENYRQILVFNLTPKIFDRILLPKYIMGRIWSQKIPK